MEYTLLCGKPKKTKAMEAGSSRHEELEEEVFPIESLDIHLFYILTISVQVVKAKVI